MLNIYGEIRYPKILSTVIAERKKINTKINFQQMSSAARIPKSYLSRVIHGKANLNEDQMELICSYLSFDEDETDYMQLLLAYERCSLRQRKIKLKKRINAKQAQKLNTEQHIDSASPANMLISSDDYYLDPIIQIVHVSLTIGRFQKEPHLLCSALNISKEKLESTLIQLEKMNAISRHAKGVKVLVNDIHLSKDSRLYQVWRNQLKFISINQLNSLPVDHCYSFSVLFSADESARVTIQNAFLEYLNKIKDIVEAAPKKETYQLSFDLFPWMARD